jgi:hypothetical protein
MINSSLNPSPPPVVVVSLGVTGVASGPHPVWVILIAKAKNSRVKPPKIDLKLI